MSPAHAATIREVRTLPKAGARIQALIAMLFGAMIVGFVGFSHLDIVHNAAHDTRHSNGYPCH